MFRYKRIIIAIASTMFSLLLLMPVSAQGLKDSGIYLGQVINGAGYSSSQQDVGDVVGTGIKLVLTLVGLIFLILMVYAGLLWMTARGEEAQVEKARKIIVAAVIGLVIVVSAYAITTLVMDKMVTAG